MQRLSLCHVYPTVALHVSIFSPIYTQLCHDALFVTGSKAQFNRADTGLWCLSGQGPGWAHGRGHHCIPEVRFKNRYTLLGFNISFLLQRSLPALSPLAFCHLSFHGSSCAYFTLFYCHQCTFCTSIDPLSHFLSVQGRPRERQQRAAHGQGLFPGSLPPCGRHFLWQNHPQRPRLCGHAFQPHELFSGVDCWHLGLLWWRQKEYKIADNKITDMVSFDWEKKVFFLFPTKERIGILWKKYIYLSC